MKIHITKQGETVEKVASKYSVSNQDLIGINPHINLTSDLVPGLKLKIPDFNCSKKANDHIEKFYPNLEHEQKLTEQAVPIGLKPLPAINPEVTVAAAHNMPHTPEYTTPWSHLDEHTVHLNPEPQPQPHHPWNPGHHTFHPHDTRAIIPPIAYYPPYTPYPYPYAYPSYGFPLPILGLGPNYGYGFGRGWHGGGHGWYGGGHGWHGGGHQGHHHR